MTPFLTPRYLITAALIVVLVACTLAAARHVRSFLRRNGLPVGLFVVGAVVFWTIVLIVAPQIFMLDLSFRFNLPRSQLGGPQDVLTFQNYRSLWIGPDGQSWNLLQLRALAVTLAGSVFVVLACFAICYPIAFHLAQFAGERRLRLALALLIVPYWINEILRAFAFRILFTDQGLINRLLLESGLISQPVDFFNIEVPLYTGLVYAYLLFMFFPLYSALRSLPHEQIEAARDLGAPWWHIHLFVVMPAAKAGIASGATMVFMLCAGSLAIPQILGGTRTLWFTPIVYDRFFESYDWPQGAAYAVMLLLTCIVVVLTVQRIFRVGLRDVVR
ncbi:ABC transporter permease [Pseudochelatococcus contaminans]|uniref:Spermidine/putrescine transport system permease protein n=1 Tax=Pseudochelatococcus contaminans TaxID=1538103 RepID=A0A7W5Z550_9HYPH|nr:ABC transporter permease [Pseudochelatococcus contaminans]MBB3810268.1 spermidine/putrescine transport system permease protein [Pseudochelatococcus contaminans]